MSHRIRSRRRGRHILHTERGQALVEFALILPVLLLVIFGIIKMGIAATSWSNETHLANEAARFAAVNSCSACGGAPIETWIITQGDTGDLKNNGTAAIKFTDAGAKNHCQGHPVQVKVSYTYTLLNLPILPKFTLPITATSTQRLEADWVSNGAGGKAPTDTYNATNASADTC